MCMLKRLYIMTMACKKLDIRIYRYDILQHLHSKQHDYLVNLCLQGKLACLQCADPAVSLQNPAVNSGILKFLIKARPQALPTQYNLSLWFPNRHKPFCLLHSNKQLESTAHILNGCPAFKGLTANKLRKAHGLSTIHTNKKIQLNWFTHLHDNSLERVLRDSPNTPDIVIVDDLLKTIVILEVGCCFDTDLCFTEKINKIPAIVTCVDSGWLQHKTWTLGNLERVHRLKLQIAGLNKKDSKQIAKYCSVLAVIGSLHIWKRCCHLYP